MLPRCCLTTIVLALPMLAIGFGVLLGASPLMAALGDAGGAHAVRVLAIVGLLLLVIDAIGLLTVVGLSALAEQQDKE